jgi:hypothetical protein
MEYSEITIHQGGGDGGGWLILEHMSLSNIQRTTIHAPKVEKPANSLNFNFLDIKSYTVATAKKVLAKFEMSTKKYGHLRNISW